MKQSAYCTEVGVLPGTDFRVQPKYMDMLDLPEAWRFGRGGGVRVAVIDTGVTPHPRLPHLVPGGDYIMEGGDGLSDCDAHGTIVASMIRGVPGARRGAWGAGTAASATRFRPGSPRRRRHPRRRSAWRRHLRRRSRWSRLRLRLRRSRGTAGAVRRSASGARAAGNPGSPNPGSPATPAQPTPGRRTPVRPTPAQPTPGRRTPGPRTMVTARWCCLAIPTADRWSRSITHDRLRHRRRSTRRRQGLPTRSLGWRLTSRSSRSASPARRSALRTPTPATRTRKHGRKQTASTPWHGRSCTPPIWARR